MLGKHPSLYSDSWVINEPPLFYSAIQSTEDLSKRPVNPDLPYTVPIQLTTLP